MHVLNLRLATALASLAIAGNAAAQLSIGAGAEYTTGKYGASESTDTLYIPFIFKYETGPWVFKATVPYIRISGPANVIGVGADRITFPGIDAERRTETGLGDISTSAFYNLMNENQSGIGLDVGVKLKLPTADEEKRLGTGEVDYALQVDVFKPFGNFTAFGSLGYRFYGDPPGLDLRDTHYYAIGASYRMAPGSTIGVAYDYRPRITTGGSEISEATLYWSRRMTREWRLQIYGVVGFSDGSPDAGVGAVLDYRF